MEQFQSKNKNWSNFDDRIQNGGISIAEKKYCNFDHRMKNRVISNTGYKNARRKNGAISIIQIYGAISITEENLLERFRSQKKYSNSDDRIKKEQFRLQN